ncbi:CPBP family intramembrane glutamic endopeptidase [Furfurilactobacillus sp. WILCCON 0119]
MNKPLDATQTSRFDRIIETILLCLMVQLPPMLLLFAPKTSFHNPSGYGLLIAYWALFGLCIWIAFRRFRHWSNERLFHDFHLRDVGIALLAYVVILVGENGLMALQQLLYHQRSTENNDAIASMLKTSPVALVAIVVSTVFLTPFLEELVFRGVFTNLFFDQTKLWPKIILSSILFSAGHASSNVISFLIYFFMGSVLAFVYQRTHKQFTSVMVHFLINAMAMSQLLLILK